MTHDFCFAKEIPWTKILYHLSFFTHSNRLGKRKANVG